MNDPEAYAEEAHRIVDEAIENACKRLSETCMKQNEISLNIDEVSPNIKWTSIEDFSVENGLLKIEEFLQVG